MKTFLGKTGNFGPDDIVDIIVEQPASAQYIVRRLFTFFVYPNPTDADLQPFVDAYTKSDQLDPRRGRGDAALGRLLLAEGVPRDGEEPGRVHRWRHQGRQRPGTAGRTDVAGQPRLGGVIGQMGQTIYEPPDVAGWPGNTSWLNASTMFARLNFVNAVTGGAAESAQPQRRPRRSLPSGPGYHRSRRSITSCRWCWTTTSRRRCVRCCSITPAAPDATLTPEKLRGLVYLVLAAPQFHVG